MNHYSEKAQQPVKADLSAEDAPMDSDAQKDQTMKSCEAHNMMSDSEERDYLNLKIEAPAYQLHNHLTAHKNDSKNAKINDHQNEQPEPQSSLFANTDSQLLSQSLMVKADQNFQVANSNSVFVVKPTAIKASPCSSRQEENQQREQMQQQISPETKNKLNTQIVKQHQNQLKAANGSNTNGLQSSTNEGVLVLKATQSKAQQFLSKTDSYEAIRQTTTTKNTSNSNFIMQNQRGFGSQTKRNMNNHQMQSSLVDSNCKNQVIFKNTNNGNDDDNLFHQYQNSSSTIGNNNFQQINQHQKSQQQSLFKPQQPFRHPQTSPLSNFTPNTQKYQQNAPNTLSQNISALLNRSSTFITFGQSLGNQLIKQQTTTNTTTQSTSQQNINTSNLQAQQNQTSNLVNDAKTSTASQNVVKNDNQLSATKLPGHTLNHSDAKDQKEQNQQDLKDLKDLKDSKESKDQQLKCAPDILGLLKQTQKFLTDLNHLKFAQVKQAGSLLKADLENLLKKIDSPKPQNEVQKSRKRSASNKNQQHQPQQSGLQKKQKRGEVNQSEQQQSSGNNTNTNQKINFQVDYEEFLPLKKSEQFLLTLEQSVSRCGGGSYQNNQNSKQESVIDDQQEPQQSQDNTDEQNEEMVQQQASAEESYASKQNINKKSVDSQSDQGEMRNNRDDEDMRAAISSPNQTNSNNLPLATHAAGGVEGVNNSQAMIYTCKECGDVFEHGQALGGHMSRKHPGQSLAFSRKVQRRKEREFERELLHYAKLKHSQQFGEDAPLDRVKIRRFRKELRKQFQTTGRFEI